MRFFETELIDQFKILLNRELYIYNYETIQQTKQKSKLLKSLKACCSDAIAPSYLNFQYRQLSDSEVFDLAIVVDKDINNVKNLYDSIQGFIIVQKGECILKPNVFCVNLICSQHARGALLIALYLYCINNNPNVTDKVGLLELANAYYNAGGLCLYSKFGFEYSSKLHGRYCFSDHNNLPMIVNLNDKYNDTNSCNQMIKDILSGNSKGFTKPIVCDLRGNRQKLLGLAMNIEKFLNRNAKRYITSYMLSDGTVLQYDVFYNELMGSSKERLSGFISNIKNINERTINNYFYKVIELPENAS